MVGRILSYMGNSTPIHANLSTIFAVFAPFIAFFLAKKLLYRLLVYLSRRFGGARRALLVGNCREAAEAFVREVSQNSRLSVTVLGAVGNCAPDILDCPRLGEPDELGNILDELRPYYAIFAINCYEKEKILKLVSICDEKCVKVYFLPAIYGFLKSARQFEHFGKTPLINIHATPLDSPKNAFLKRSEDIIGALFLIILTSPIMLITAIGVKLSSRGKALFRQVRVGKMGKRFVMLKFRSMREDRGAKASWSTGIDKRKTRLGNFIRKTSIDELPQLFNVLRGEMSLVGPRPEIASFVEKFKGEIPLYMIKHYVKPGMTGLAQINGLRGNTSIEDRICADIYYIENWSLMLDITILLKTPLKAINKSEVYSRKDEKSKPNEE